MGAPGASTWMRTRIAPILLALAAALVMAAPASADVKSLTFRSRPIDIAAYQALRGSNFTAAPKIDGFVTEMDAHVVDATTGAELPQYEVMLHHIVFTDQARRDGACPRNRIGERFYGTSEELRGMTLPPGYGYRIGARDRWRMIWMLMNHLGAGRRVFVEYHVTVDTSPDLTPVRPYWVSVVPCVSDPQYSVPGGGPVGSVSSRRVTWRPPVTGRIVAMGGHLHGGSIGLSLTQPRCGGRLLNEAKPTYAPPGDPLYSVVPMLHEPDPVDVSWWQSRTGMNVRAGEKLRITASYDGHSPHMRVMGIMHVYIAKDRRVGNACGPRPGDIEIRDGFGLPGARLAPPQVAVPFEAVGANGAVRTIHRPPGAVRSYRGSADVQVEGFAFNAANVSIPAGARVRWHFRDRTAHDATLVSGPRGFGTATVRNGHVQAHRFRVPGIYRVYCSMHPVDMTQVIRVRPRRAH